MKRFVPLFFGVLCAGGLKDSLVAGCSLTYNTPVSQVTSSWCWAANMEFVAKAYSCNGAQQCAFAEELYRVLFQDPFGDCCPNGGTFCQFVAPDYVQYKDAMLRNGFSVALMADGSVAGALTAVALRDVYLCAGMPVVGCFGNTASTITSGHAGTFYGILDSGQINDWLCQMMDPARGQIAPAYGNLFNNAYPGGIWFKSLPVTNVDCIEVGIDDIETFVVSGSAHDVGLSFEIQGGANPNEYASVYVSDNPAGPARLIDVLTDHATLMPGTNSWTDAFRLPPAGTYYYWLDYGSFPPQNALRSPEDLFAAPVPATVTGPSPPEVLPLNDLTAEDIPLDFGEKVLLTWTPFSQEVEADYYNVYRNSHPANHPELGHWKYIASLAPEVGSYLDEHAATAWINQYKVSIAHHGLYILQPSRGNTGIWNTMSNTVACTPVHNFWNSQVTLLSADTLRVCPDGDDESLQARFTIWGSNIAPTVGIPPEGLVCYQQDAFATFCDGPVIPADAPTNASGQALLTTSAIGGHGRTDVVFRLAENPEYPPTFIDTFAVYLKSPDVDGNGFVNVADFSAFGGAYTSPPKQYSWFLDFSPPFGTITLPDFGYFSSHNNHQCQGSSVVADQSVGTSNAGIEFNLTEVVSASGRLLHADLTARDLTLFKAALFNLRTDNPMLSYETWESGSYPGRVLAVPVVRDGIKEFAIGVLDGEEFADRTAALGRIVYRINGNEDLALTPRDFEARAADVLSKDGSVLRASGFAGNTTGRVSRIISDTLAQNRPNPFNPTTTVSYAISRRGRVTLRVFAVDGSLVKTLVDSEQKADRYDAVWDGTNDAGTRVASGVYFYALRTPSFSSTKKMVLLK